MSKIVPTTVFSGFLGSGKTTIISHLITDLQNEGQQVVYIKNEIGNENIDAELMRGKHIQTKELLNGCICCTLVGPFVNAIDEIIDTLHPNRIIIEASGAADPAAIALMIDSHPRLQRDGVISIIDVTNFQGYKDLSQTARNQTKFTDLIVFNKIELADLPTKQAVVGYVRELNEYSPIVEAPRGLLDKSVAFGLSAAQLAQLSAELKNSGYSLENVEHHHHPHQDHLTVDNIESFSIDLPNISMNLLENFLQELPGSVYRVKGIFYSERVPYLINKVGARLTIQPALGISAEEHQQSKLVLIGFKIKQLQDQLRKSLAQATSPLA